MQPLQALVHVAGALGSAVIGHEALDTLGLLRVAERFGGVAIVVHLAGDTFVGLAVLFVWRAIRVFGAAHAHAQAWKAHALRPYALFLALAGRDTPTVAGIAGERRIAAVLGHQTLPTVLGEAVGFVVLAVTTRHAVHTRVRGRLAELVATIGVRQTSHAQATVAVGGGGRAREIRGAGDLWVLG